MTLIPNRADFRNRPDALSEGATIPGARRHYRPPALDQIHPAELAALVLRRRHRLPHHRAVLVADLAGLGREALS